MAPDYESAFGDDLSRLPLDRAMLDLAADTVSGDELVLDLGCGTGSAGRHLASRGLVVIGMDLSLGMLRTAPSRPRLRLVQADLRALPVGDRASGLVAAFYVLHHLPRTDLGAVLAEVARVLRPGGTFLLATHLGTGHSQTDELLGHRIQPVGAAFYSASEMTAALAAADFEPVEVRRRDPLAHEYPSERIYLMGSSRRP